MVYVYVSNRADVTETFLSAFKLIYFDANTPRAK